MQLIRTYGQSLSDISWPVRGDRIGVIASVLCAIHCALTPFLLLFMPVFGKIWAHPASHWMMALLVVPLAAFTVWTGYRKHRRKWVVACCGLGILFVLVGAAAPSFEKSPESLSPVSAPQDSESTNLTIAEDDCGSSACASECSESTAMAASQVSDSGGIETVGVSGEAACVDSCCPSIQTSADGGWKLHVPLASILTTIGGLFLITTHIGNLCRCSCCDSEPTAA